MPDTCRDLPLVPPRCRDLPQLDGQYVVLLMRRPSSLPAGEAVVLPAASIPLPTPGLACESCCITGRGFVRASQYNC
jgi:hypothetical protein